MANVIIQSGLVPSIALLLLITPLLFPVSLAQTTPVPSGCLKKNGIAVGWLPDWDSGVDMSPITNELNLGNPCFYGAYSQIKSTTYSASQLTSRMDDIKSSGAILQAAVMPTEVKFSEVNTDLANQIASAMKQFTDNGIEVWLRFAHEMNWYVTKESGPTYPGGSTDEFRTAWQNVANAVKGNSMVKMYWSPNQVGDISDLEQWWPGADYVDVVGIDIYPKSSDQASSFASVYGSFIDTYSTPYNKPFVVGETGATDDATKRTWLTQLVSPDALSSYPSYGGWSWFEYNKEGKDFRVVTGSEDIAKPILSS